MLTLYITRHAETIWNTEGRLQGWQDSDLTESGKKNALGLGNRLKDVAFDAIYASSSKRTLETAALVKGNRSQEIIAESNLREIFLGDWEGQTHTEIESQYPEEYHSFWHAPELYTPISGESFQQLLIRVTNFLNKLEALHQDGNVLIVTHTVFIKALMMYCKKLSIEQLWAPPFIHDTSLSIIEIHNGKRSIIMEGDIHHRND
ncbi:histidine phosphatase family protein [Lysinibacillus louembei]|uniref:Histidine phosphatase family protein n=1 Tax=Lysinibacillus louembei TaxID=1470088 RepID=A0ABZ0S1W8_9BACI|nr:histidine phosphatase family protein [Lysinibacillus louembei]WPK13765.1 histidine phosphatase family protein [Lysinibacillus louembei]